MKKKFFLSILFMAFCSWTNAQTCILPETYSFLSQSSVDNFPVNYPGCTNVEGRIDIQGSGITNLDGLANLTSISGSLMIQGTSIPTDLSALDNLDSIGGGIVINNNSSLKSLSGLNGLTKINGVINIINNAELTSLNGFADLQTVNGNFRIEGNPVLESIGSLGKLENITSGNKLVIAGNSALANLDGLQGFTQVDGDIIISENENLTSLDSLAHLTSVGGTMEISYNPALQGLAGLDSLAYVFFLTISYNDGLSSLSGLSGLEEVGYFTIRENPLLTDLTGLENLRRVNNLSYIWGNAALENLGPLHLADTIQGEIFILENPVLSSIQALGNISVIGGFASSNNVSLESLAGLGHLHRAGYLGIGGSPLIENVHELGQLDTVIGSLGLGIPLLSDLSGLENLRYVGGSLGLVGNENLTDLTALSNLHHIGDGLYIEGNLQLASLVGLDSAAIGNSDGSATNVKITDNPQLSFCGIQSICDVLSMTPFWAIISGNAKGCATHSDVNAVCGINPTEEEGFGNVIRIYPNPGSGAFTIESDVPGRYSGYVMDGTGRKMAEIKADNGQALLDLSGLPDGMYFVRLVFDGGSVVRRVVKVQGP